MNLSELSSLIKWVKKEIVDPQVIQKYSALLSILQTNSQPNQSKQPFEQQKNDLTSSLVGIKTDELTKDQIKFLETINLLSFIGKSGVNNIEDILYKNVIDLATSANKIQSIVNTLNAGVTRMNQLEIGLQDCIPEIDIEMTNQVLMRITFKGNAQMNNLTDFKNWGGTWYDIGRGIAMANNSAPEDIKIIGAGKGSIIIELLIAKYIAKSVTEIIMGGLQVAEKVLDIRKKSEEIKALKLANEKIAIDLADQATTEKDTGIDKIKNDMVKKLGLDEKNQGDKITALGKSIKDLVTFIEKGGDVDLIIPESSDPEEENSTNTELRVAFSEIRQLERKIDLLEFNLKDDENDELE